MKRTLEEDRIYQALSSIQTPAAPLEEGVRVRLEGHKRHNRPYFRMAVAAACLTVLLGTAVGAAGLADAWRSFFPGVPEEAVTALALSQTCGDYTLTLEDAVADDTGALFLLSLTRTDGGALDPQLRLSGGTSALAPSLLADGTPLRYGGGVVDCTLSEDGKTTYFIYEVTGANQSLTGKDLTFTVPVLSDGIAEASFALTFQVDTSSALTLPLDTVEILGTTCPVRELRISAREITLDVEGTDLDTYGFLYQGSEAFLELTRTDGSRLKVPCTGGRVKDGICTFWYIPELGDDTRAFLDPKEIQSVTIGTVTFPVS